MGLRLMNFIDVPGYASISISIFFFGGVQLFSVGLLGIYVSNILVQVQNRPDFVVQSTTNLD
jgi:dolichol-phosphate mannosyltransferase